MFDRAVSAWRLKNFARLALLIVLVVPSSRAAAIPTGFSAPEIQLTDFSGRPVSLASLRGKVVLLDFWASWCKPCREELPVLDALQKKYGANGLVIIGVNVDKDEASARKFLQDNKLQLSFALANDAKHKVAGSYEPPTMPSSYLIDRSGKVRFVHEGFRASDAAKMDAEIQQLLN
jgi:thiol-disulfide isomerase/thioredoxin